MNKLKKLTLCTLASMCYLNQSAFTIHGEEENTDKEEVVYVNLEEDGKVKDITVVNIFDLDKAQTVVDYGDYTSVRNMTSMDTIHSQNGVITIEASDSGKLYYEGTIASTSIPWNIDISYSLDGRKVSVEELANQSGHLKIQIKIDKNESYIGNFYEGYALQVSLALDANKCKNIKSKNATIANVGSNKQLSYIILPNKDTDILIESDVVDFEMDAISINGVKLNLSLEVDDSKIQDKVDTITDAVSELDDGARKLKDGSNDLYDATTTLKDNTAKLKDGTSQLYEGASSLASGADTLNKNSDTLVSGANSAFDGLCEAINEVLNQKLNEQGLDSITLTKDNYATVLNGLLEQLDADQVYKQAYEIAYATVSEAVTSNVEEMGEELYKQYIHQNSDSIYAKYVMTNRETLYQQVAYSTVLQTLVSQGMSEDVAKAYLTTSDGQAKVNEVYTQMLNDTTTYDQAIISNLTDDQKQAILSGAVLSLTEEEKSAIKQGVIAKTIEEKMVSDEVQRQINEAVTKVSEAAGTVSSLKGKLDQYAVFVQGVKDYTSAVGTISSGANSLKENLNTLDTNMNTLKDGTVELNDAVKELYDGTDSLKEGTSTFMDKTSTLSSDVTDEIDDMVNELTGSDIETESFVSASNTNTESVQFVIKTSGIHQVEEETINNDTEESLSFIQKLLQLFGIN